MAKKLTKEDVKGPDAFIAVTDRVIAWLEEHSKSIFSVVIGGALLGGGFMAANQWQDYQETTTQSALYEIEAQEKQVFEGLGKDLKDEEKVEYKDVESDFGEVLRKYKLFAQDHSGSRAAYIASLNSADILQKYKEFAKARDVLAGVVSKVPENDFFFGLVNMQMANIEINLKNFREALVYLEKILEAEGQGHFHPQTLLNIGLCHHNLSEYDEAQNYYQRLESEFADSNAAQLAKTYTRYMYLNSNLNSSESTGEDAAAKSGANE